MNNNICFEMKNISKSFNGNQILKEISFKLMEGESLGIAGMSGSGKSTIAQIAVGLLKADIGTVEVMGKEVPSIETHRRDIKEYPIQMVFQNSKSAFNPRLTLRKSIMDIATRCNGGNAAVAIDRVKELLELCSLEESLLDRYQDQLSGGQLQRMAICRTMVTKPKVLIADEIISALDIPVQLQIMEVLRNIVKRENMTIIFISHDLNAIKFMTEKAMVLKSGKIEFLDDTRKLWNSSNKAVRELIDASNIISI